MKIILTNGMELNPILVTGRTQYIQGANRDVLTFVFDSSMSMDELDGYFTEVNCESIKIVGDDNCEAIHNGYTIRAELVKKLMEAQKATADVDVEMVTRVTISMAQRTYAETKLAQVAQEITDTQLALVEIVEGGVE